MMEYLNPSKITHFSFMVILEGAAFWKLPLFTIVLVPSYCMIA